jgi:hypothetical protein
MTAFRYDRFLAGVLCIVIAGWIGLNGAVWWPQLVDETPVYLEPQGSVRSVLAEAWITDGKPTYALRPDLGDDSVALLPRDASLVEQSVVPKDFAYAVVAAAALAGAGSVGSVVFALFLAAAAASVIGAVVWELTKQLLPAFVGAALAMTSVVWWAGSYGGVSLSFAGVTAGMLAVWVLLRYRQRPVPVLRFDNARFLVAGALVGVAVGFHYATFPWWSSLLLASAVGLSGDRTTIIRRLAWCAGGGALALAPVLAFNAWLYGSPTVTGYSEFATVLDAVGWEAGGIGFSPRAVTENLGVYLTRPEILPLLVAAAYAHRLVDSVHLEIHRRHAVIVGVGLSLLVGVSASSPLWGTGTFLTNASMLRYLAPVMALVFVATAVGFDALWESRQVLPRIGAGALVVFCLAVNMTTVLRAQNGIVDTRQLLRDTSATQEAVLDLVPEEGLVITRRLDKVLFPHRATVTASYLVTSTPAGSGVVHLYDTLPDDEELLGFIGRVDDRPVFIMNDTGWVSSASQARLEQALAGNDRCLHETVVSDLWEVAPCGGRVDG